MHARTYQAIDTRLYIHPHTRACTRRWATDERRYSRRCACVCASIQGVRTCLDAQASIHAHFVQMGIPHPRAHVHMRTHPWNLRAHTDTHMHSYIRTQMYVRSDTHLVGARVCCSRRALTRTYAHAHTLAWNLHVHPYACQCTHTYTYKHGDTHLAVASSCCAAAPAARAHTHAHSCNSARTYAKMHSMSAGILPYMRAYTCD
jgi:hypothetical protein